ncbi:ABC transporter substrate-binding protein [Halococcus thailandensis]|nr:ABC transporter substrate-binding protein [Halococcus thailandensis]
MANDSRADGAMSRRNWLRSGAVVLGSGLLAGCSGGSAGSGGNSTDSGSGMDTAGSTESTATSEPTGETTETEGSATAMGSSYTVTMSPVGEVQFDSVPKNVMVYSMLYSDMAVAYGHGDAVNSLGFRSDAAATLDALYSRLDGVSFDRSGLTQLNSGNSSGGGGIQVDKEVFYNLDSDLHLVDPALMVSFDGWKMADIKEIRENIAPWFGNLFSRNNEQPPRPYRGNYQYYTLWELSGKVAKVFQNQQRFQQLSRIHDDLVSRIQSNLPPKNERPTVGSVLFIEESFYPSKINTSGFGNAHIRPLNASDAFTQDDVTYETTYSMERMLEIDPDVILHRYGITTYDVNNVRQTLEDDPVGSQLSAVQNDRVYAGAYPVQGPLMNLFQLEMTAKQLYPNQFGEWPDFTSSDPYPEIPQDQQLFDRQKVADIVTGNS